MLPLEVDRDDTANRLGEGGEHGVGEVEVFSGGVAPSSGGAGGAEVGGRDGDGPAVVAPIDSTHDASELEACSTSGTAVEQRRTQRGRREPVAGVV